MLDSPNQANQWRIHMARLTVPEQHQLRIAKDTLRNPAKALLGPPSVEQAAEIVERLTRKAGVRV